MQISTKVRYGMRAMLEIALQTDGKPVITATIAKNQNISKKYLEALLTILRTTDFIRSIRGSKGGYVLTREPKDITLEDIFIALEGPIEITHCANSKLACEGYELCVTRDLWVEMSQLLSEYLRDKTLQYLVDLHKAKREII
jgi:Rrf2 family protein